MTKTAAFYLAAAADKLAKGFTSKAGQKSALDDVNRALDVLKGNARDRILSEAAERFPDAGIDEALWKVRCEWTEEQGYWSLPDYPHLIRDHHLALFRDAAHEVADCREMRQLIVVAPVVKIERDTTVTEAAAKVRESILDIMKRRRSQYDRALALHDLFGGLPVSANVHVCVNEHGTSYVRAFYYLRGEFTALNVILAAADEIHRRSEAA